MPVRGHSAAMTLTPKFKEKYARRLSRLIDILPLRKQAFLQVHAEMKAEGIRVTDRTLYNWMDFFSS